MNWNAVSFDWNQTRAFLATVEEGSLSAAARVLGLTQPTLSRQVACLEEELGVILFERNRRNMTLTESGLELVEYAREMAESAMRISLAATGQSQAIEGDVSITAPDLLSTYTLPIIVEKIRAKAPGINIEVISSNAVHDLTKREADIAIRHERPEQPELIAKLVCNTTGHFYASKDYLAQLEHPITLDVLNKADFVGHDSVEWFLPIVNSFGLQLTADNLKIITSSGVTLLELVKQGLGISVLYRHVADLNPNLQRVFPECSIPVPIWLITHKELRTNLRIRMVYDILAEALAEI
jgi:DNA-binding transcriptional LysR family regulator